MKSVKIKYFAALREQSNREVEGRLTDAATPRELYQKLKQEYNFTVDEHILRCAINDSYQSLDTPIANGDKIVFIPPVSGG